MFCSNCGKMLPDGAAICPECGLNVAVAQQSMPDQQIMKPVELAEPMPIDNGVFQNNDSQISSNGGFSYPQDSGQNVNGYDYQQNPEQSANGYGYQQNFEQGSNGYGYQQNTSQDGYTYQQNMNQNGAYQPQNAQGSGYYDGFGTGTPEGYRGSSGEAGQPGTSGAWIAALVLGILSIFVGVIGGFAFGVIGAGIGIVSGIAGLIVAINFRKSNGGGAVGGLVTSIIGVSLSVVMLMSCAACSSITDGYGYLGCVGEACNTYSDTAYLFRNNR